MNWCAIKSMARNFFTDIGFIMTATLVSLFVLCKYFPEFGEFMEYWGPKVGTVLMYIAIPLCIFGLCMAIRQSYLEEVDKCNSKLPKGE